MMFPGMGSCGDLCELHVRSRMHERMHHSSASARCYWIHVMYMYQNSSTSAVTGRIRVGEQCWVSV